MIRKVFSLCLSFLLWCVVIQLVNCKSSKVGQTAQHSVTSDKDKSTGNAEKPTGDGTKSSGIDKITIDEFFTGEKLGATTTIDSVSIRGDILIIGARFSGGCKEHEFTLISNKQYLKSLPPKLKLYLSHDNNRDACRELIKKALYFNISEIKYPGTKSLIITINGYKHPITYNY